VSDGVPSEPVTIAVALADKFDQLAGFFAIGQRPRGSGDPYALRRAALGVVRIIRENGLRLPLRHILVEAAGAFETDAPVLAADILAFITERLRVQLRGEGARHDVLAAVFAAGADDDLVRALARTEAIAALLKTEDGANLLAAYRRAANILRIEDKEDGPHRGEVEDALLVDEAERSLQLSLQATRIAEQLLDQEDYVGAMGCLAQLRGPLDRFFERVTVNADAAGLRKNRLNLLHSLRRSIDSVADFSQIEGT
jgi:glycyl-tRNA synthetase beta chain